MDPVKAGKGFHGVFPFRGDQTDGANRLISTTYPDGTSDLTSYDSLGHIVGTTNQNLKSTNYFYDAAGRSVSVQYPDNRFVTYGYDNEGNQTSQTTIGSKSAGSQTTYTHYDLLGRADAVTNTDGSFTHTVYDAQGRVTDSYDELGNDTHNDYDQASRKLDVITGSGLQTTSYTYDNNGNELTVSVAGVNQSTTSYDSLNRATTVTYESSSVLPVITTYDADSRKLSQTDQGGKLTQYGYDGQSHLVGVTLVSSSGNQTEGYTYDNVGNMLSQTDANGHKTTFTYNTMNRRTSRTLPDGITTETYDQYDNVGNLVHKTTFKGQGISYSYDQNTDQLTGETFAEGSIIFSYDGFLRRQSMQDVSGTTNYNYDQRNRLVTKSSPFGTLTYGYDNHSNLTSVESSNTNGTTVTYEYDPLNRPVTVTDYHASVRATQTAPNLITTYGYDPIGNLAIVQKPNGEAVTYAYDILNRLTSMAATVGGNAIASYAYTLGAGGNRTSVNELSGRAVSWTYDDLYKLTAEIISNDPVAANIGAISYQYDPVGNRTNRTSGIAAVPSQPSLSYDADDRLTGGGYTFDANGSTTVDPNGTYVYDSLGRMTAATVNGNVSTYIYDGDGNKVQETSNSGTRMFLVDKNNPTGYAQVLEVLQGGGVSKVYTYGKNRISEDQLISANWTLDFYGYDGQGSVRYLSDINGIIQNQYTYDAFGNTIYQNTTVPNPMLFDGEEQSPNTGFYDLRARWMNPGIGRFQTMDKLQVGPQQPLSLNYYIGFSDDPIDRIDPSGNDDFTMASLNIGGADLAAEGDYERASESQSLNSDVIVKIIKHSRVQGWGAGFDLTFGAITKNRGQWKYYKWIQKVKANWDQPFQNKNSAGKTVSVDIPANTWFYDAPSDAPGELPSIKPKYYLESSVPGFDTAFIDYPFFNDSVVLETPDEVANVTAHTYLVGLSTPTSPASSAHPVAVIQWGISLTRNGDDITRKFKDPKLTYTTNWLE